MPFSDSGRDVTGLHGTLSVSWNSSSVFPGTPFHQISIQTPGRVPVSPSQSTQAAPGERPFDARSGPIAYLVIGVIVASQHTYYYANLGSFSQVVSAVAATALWPLLVLLGADLHVSLPDL